ncbi:MAG: ECF-type sigma factor [Phycisphaerales bacterium]|nr:ECF-type sigma factor [Phycisphaerales bacterium]
MSDDLKQRAKKVLTAMTGDIDGDAELLFEQVYDELRSLASRYLRRERPNHTLQPTALVHEAYLRIRKSAPLDAENGVHFRALAARIMRQLLIEHARSSSAAKRGGGLNRVTLITDLTPAPEGGLDFLELEEAMDRLRHLDERLVQVVELRFYGGLTIEETAFELGISPTVVKDDWRTARAMITSMLKD